VTSAPRSATDLPGTAVDVPVDPDRVALVLTVLMDGLDGRWLCHELSTEQVRSLLRYTLDLCLQKGQGQQ
jgi:hypothetical protein